MLHAALNVNKNALCGKLAVRGATPPPAIPQNRMLERSQR
jgi:hypothetical protein